MTESLWALVPLKNLRHAKERLAAELAPGVRRELVEAMALDVLAALRAVPLPPTQILLVSDDPDAALLARAAGVDLFVPGPAAEDPLNAALGEATRHVIERGAARLLVLHADLPCVTAGELRALIAVHRRQAASARESSVTLVTDGAGGGTNCLLSTPPGALPYRFGAGSRRLHQAAAESLGVAYGEFSSAGLMRDIDQPAELAALVAACQSAQNGCGEHTAQLLARLHPVWPSS